MSKDSFGNWLRHLPIRTDRINVLSYDNEQLQRPSAAVVLMDVGRRDLQQCADSAIRLHAEFLWHSGKAKDAGYYFTSGDLSKWVDWRGGERYRIRGRGPARPRSDSHASYRRYHLHLCGTLSLHRDTTAVGGRPYEPDVSLEAAQDMQS